MSKDTKQQDIQLPKLGKEYIYAVGRRKCAVAQVRLYAGGEGKIFVNGEEYDKFFETADLQRVLLEPLILASRQDNVNISVKVKGGGTSGQCVAARHGISRALVSLDEELRKVLKKSGLLTRDPRVKERKKPGLKKARRAPQWKKR